jgi:hypothetical protein
LHVKYIDAHASRFAGTGGEVGERVALGTPLTIAVDGAIDNQAEEIPPGRTWISRAVSSRDAREKRGAYVYRLLPDALAQVQALLAPPKLAEAS